MPLPPELNLNWPAGRAFTYAMSSFSELTGTEAWTITSCGAAATIVIGARSFAGSNARFG